MPDGTTPDAKRMLADCALLDPQVDARVEGFLTTLDRRTRRARTYESTLRDLIADLGGPEQASAAEVELARRAAALAVMAADQDRLLIEGSAVEVFDVCAVSNALQRVLNRLGIRRNFRPRPALVDLDEQDQRA